MKAKCLVTSRQMPLLRLTGIADFDSQPKVCGGNVLDRGLLIFRLGARYQVLSFEGLSLNLFRLLAEGYETHS